MRPHKDLLLAGGVLMLVIFTRGVPAQDCYKLNSLDPVWWSPGEYDDATLDTTICKARCGQRASAYSATQNGKYCFCTNTAPVPANKVAPPNTYCNIKCTGGTEMCGGRTHVTVNGATAAMSDPWMKAKPADTIIETGQKVTLQFGVTGINEQFNFDFDDGAGSTKSCYPTGFKNTDSDKNVQPVFRKPGVYDVRFEVQSPAVPSLAAAVGIVVQSKVTAFRMQCPEQVAVSLDEKKREEEYACTVETFTGSAITGTFEFGTSKILDNVAIADPPVNTAGPGIPQFGTCTGGTADRTYVMPGSEFTEDGTIIGWEFNMEKTGDLSLLVLEPSCGSGSFCYDSYTCQATCEVRCSTATQSFCTSNSQCTAKTITTCPIDPRSQKPTFDWMIKHVVPVTTVTVGYNYIDLTTVTAASLNVTRGMAVGAVTKGIIGTKTPWTGPSDYSENYIAPRQGDTIKSASLDDGATTKNKKLLVRALVSKASVTKVYHNCLNSGDYEMTATLTTTGAVGSVTQKRKISCQYGIDYCILDAPNVAEAGKAVTLEILEHKGTNISYMWNYDDSSAVKKEVSLYTVHTFAVRRTYNVCVECKNAVSSKSNCTSLDIKDKIGTVTVTTTAATAGVDATIKIAISKGTGYKCSVDFGDGTIAVYNDTQLPITTGQVVHTYTTPNKYTIKVSCRNGITPDPEVQTATQDIEEKLTYVKINPPGAKKNEPVQVMIQTNVKNGHGLTYTCTSTPPFKANTAIDTSHCTNKPSCASTPISDVLDQKYSVSCTATNKLGSVDTTIDFTIDAPLDSPFVNISKRCNPVKFPPDITNYYIMAPSCIEFTATIKGGSNAFVKIDYGDGTTASPNVQLTSTNPEVISHQYTMVGTFEAKAIIGNGNGEFNWKFVIKAYKKMDFQCNIVDPQKAGKVEIKFKTPDGMVPPDVEYSIDFGDGTTKAYSPFNMATPVAHIYNDPNSYNVTTTFKNSVETYHLACTFQIIEAIMDPRPFWTPEHAVCNSPGTELSLLMQVGKGSGMKVTYNWNYPTSSSSSVTVNFPKSLTPTLVSTRRFDRLGSYTCTVKIFNDLSMFTFTHKVYCQNGVFKDDFEFTSDAPRPTTDPKVTFTLKWIGTTEPTDASGELQYGKPLDGQAAITPVYAGTKILKNTKTYQSIGCRTAKMVIKNYASSITWEADASIQDSLQDFYIIPKYRPAVPLNGVDKPGLGTDKNHFPSNRDIKLYTKFYGGKLESVDKYELIAESTSYVWLCNSTDIKPGDPLTYKIPAPGTYNICITASNKKGSVSNCTTVIVGDTPHGITIDDSRITTKPNELKTFKIAFAKVGTNSCVAVNFDFKSTTLKKWHLYGKKSDCTKQEVEKNLNLPADAERNYIDRALDTSGWTLSHTYTSGGHFEIKVIGGNYIAASSASLEFSVSKDQKCQRPEIKIDDARPFENGTRCDRGSDCKIRGIVDSLNCDPQDNIKDWTMEQMNDNETVNKIIDIKSCAGHNGLYLTIPRHFPGAGLGVYRLTLTVQMTGSSDIKDQKFISTAVTFIWIVRGPIYASMIYGGLTFMTLGKKDQQTFDAAKYSVDSDVDPSAPKKKEFRYKWFAKQTQEPDNPDTTTLMSPTPSDDNHGGCFGNGVGRLDIPETSGTFTPDFSRMPINGSCNITVIVQVYDHNGTDDRSGLASVVVKIVEGKPPIVSIICSDERFCVKTQFGQRLIRPSGLCKLSVKCLRNCPDNKAYRENEAIYRWKIRYSYKNTKTAFGQVDSLIYVPDVSKTTPDSQRPYIGEESEELTLLPPLFEKESDLYQAELTLSYLGLRGIAEMNFTVNRPPTKGSCSVSPKTGTYISTKFVVSGAGWSDERKVRFYEIYVNFPQTGTATDNEFVKKFIAVGEGDKFNLTSTLRQGTLGVKVRVYDDEGAYTECAAGEVTVSPNIMSTKELASSIDSAFQKGNPGEVAETCVEGLSAGNDKQKKLANLVDLSKGNQLLTPAQENLRAEGTKFIGNVLKKLAVTPVILGPKENIEILTSVVRLPSLNDRTLTPMIQQLLANTLDEIMNDPVASVEDKIDIVARLLACGKDLELGQKTTRQKPGNEARQEAKKKARPNMALPKSGKPFDGSPQIEEDEAITSTNHELSDEQSNAIHAKSRNISKQCLGLLANLVPTGGSPIEVKSGEIVVSIQKDEVQTGRPVIVKQGAAEADMEPLCQQTNLPICNDARARISSVVLVSQRLTSYSTSDRNLPSIESPEIEINYLDENGDEIRVNSSGFEVKFTLKLKPSEFEQTPGKVPHMEHSDPYLSISIRANYSSVSYPPYCNYESSELYVRPVAEPFDPNKAYMIFIAFDKRVNLTSSYYNATVVVPKWEKGKVSDPYTITLDKKAKSSQLKAKDPCTVYVGLRELNASEFETYNRTGVKPDVNNETLASWKSKKGNVTANLTISTYIQSCCYFDVAKREWSHEGCWVNPKKSSRTKVVCSCNHLTSFAGGWAVVPNKLDFNFIFANLDFAKNPTVYSTLIVIIILYSIGAIICRRADMKDVQRACVNPMVDNDPDDKYMYEVVVATGMSKGAGTQSKVYFVLSGENDETDVRVLHDRDRGNKHCLNRGNIDSFLLTTPRPLGDLNYARIWHDNSGKGKYASWYLKYFLVNDLQSKKKYQFILNRWLAVEEDDGQIDRLIPVAGMEQMVEFGHLFSQTTRKNFNDEHLWISLVGRPPRSRFTRLQRCSCCFQLLALTMMTNAMFYGLSDTEKPNTNALEIGPFTLSPQQLSVGIMSNLVIFPATFLTVWMFRKTRPKKKRRSRIQEAKERKIKEENENNGTASVSDVQAEVNKNEDMEMCEVQPARPPPYFENDIHGLNDLQNQIHVINNGRPESPPDSGDKKIGIPMDNPLIKKRKKKFSLPPYCRIISWILLWVCVAIGLTFSFFYGVSFGEVKCKKWITSMMIAFLMSVFITQPIKVFLVALFFSLVLKKADDDGDEDEEDEEEPELQYDEQWLNQPNGQGTFGVTKPRMIAYKPPDPVQLEKYRENRLKELKMYSIIKEVLSYCLYVWVLLSVSYSFRDPDSYTLQDEMVNVFIHSNKGDPGADYRKINTFKGYWDWTKQVLLPALIVDPWYDNKSDYYAQAYGQRGFISDRSQRLMGYAVIRQLRAKPFSCNVEKVMQVAINECVEGYGMFSQEEGTFGVGWTPYNKTLNNTREEYTYTSAFALDGLPYAGNLAVYSGGGYVHRLQGGDKELMDSVDRLMDELWLDTYTRAIFVEFTVYNPNINLFSVSTILTEVPGSTAMVNTFRFESINLLGDYHGDGKWYEITCQVLFCAFLLFFIYRETKTLIKEKAGYFKQVWNLCETAIIGLSIGAIAIYFYRYFITKGLVAAFKKSHGLTYIKFQYVAYWNELLLYLVGWLVFLANLKFLRLLRFNKRMGVLGSVLRHSRKDMFAFGIMFSIIFFAYVQFFYLIFLRELVGYKSFIASAETSLNIMLGKFDFKAMLDASPILAPFFFFLFVVTIIMVLINMFLSILNESFTIVKNDVSKQSNDFEMVDFIMRRFKSWTGIGHNQPQLPPGAGDDTLNNQREGMNGMPVPFEMQIDNFPDKIDKLLNSISKVYFDHDKIDALLDPNKMGKDGKATMKMMMKQQQMMDAQKDNQARAAALNIHMPMPDVESIERRFSLAKAK
ncbi:uncharacterized protein LOC135496476 isoform X2 [Lineus longissimus]|uniref:uncharacterized protein LOC135496476 isoform X2 n=1 Tax=Lineus longissimus TaxID=88925 RepID=UPI00315D741D